MPRGVPASTLRLPRGDWRTVFDCVCAHFPAISRAQWQDRFARGRVLDAYGRAIDARHPYHAGLCIRYFREVNDEPRIPFDERVLHVDEELVVADKPHFLPVMPAGRYVAETQLGRLVRRTGNPHLVPLHRIDRATAGVVLFSANPASRARYQALFRERRIAKNYEALAAALPDRVFPIVRRTRLVRGEPFFRMREAEGEPNSETRIDVVDRDGPIWRYALTPVTGRKHQLRVHMAALGAAILGDAWYPDPAPPAADEYDRPLRLLARRVVFVDPLTGLERCCESDRSLGSPQAPRDDAAHNLNES
jgi:tRNA pseudouridine32 synthase/23S rRNA pseudouridine746 synthase